MKIVGKTDVGLIREINEDSLLIVKNNDYTLAIVCDGIGGSNAGEVASLLVSKYLGEQFLLVDTFESIEDGKEWFKKVLYKANDLVYTQTLLSTQYSGMGTTFVGALFIDNKILIANVGDSRAYLLDNNELIQITVDHSVVTELYNQGKISEQQAKVHPKRNYLTNAIGVVGNLKVDFFEIDYGEKLLITSDGLSSYVSHNDILKVVNSNNNLEYVVDKLIELANKVGGYDNTSVIVCDLGGYFNE